FKKSPDYRAGTRLLVRFLSYLRAAVRNIRNGRIPRLLNPRQDGMLSIRQGRKGEGDVLADELPARPDSDAALGEMIEDIVSLLRRKEALSTIPLVALFRGMLSGMTAQQQRQQFGDSAA